MEPLNSTHEPQINNSCASVCVGVCARVRIWDSQGRQSRIGSYYFVDTETKDQRAGKNGCVGRVGRPRTKPSGPNPQVLCS